MPTADVQELLVHRVTEQSVERMRSKIRATLALVTLVAGIVGGEGLLRIQALNEKLDEATSLATALRGRIDTLNAEIGSAKRLEAEIQMLHGLDEQAFSNLLGNYQMMAQTATRDADRAANTAASASSTANEAAARALTHLDSVRNLTRLVESTNQAVQSSGRDLDSLRNAIRQQVFGTWTLVLDEGGAWVPVDTTALEARVTRIHSGHIVDLQLRDRHTQLPVCERELRAAGARGECQYGHDTYRVTLVLPLKQGGLFGLFGLYRDRAEVQIARVGTVPAGIAASPASEP